MKHNKIWLAVVVLSWIVLASCSYTEKKQPSGELLLHDHVLAEKIWDVANGEFIKKHQLLNNIADYDYILLGETHDNPLHHRYQALAIHELASKQRRLKVAFEMINEDKQEILQNQNATTADELFDLLNWEIRPQSRKKYSRIMLVRLIF